MKRLLPLWFLLLLLPPVAPAQKARPTVFVLDIRAEIDPRMTRYVDLALAQAQREKADYVVVDMDTYGGTVNDGDAIRMKMLAFPKPVYVFINRNAASAGALIAIACDSIYMTAGADIGAATVVVGGTGEAAPDKYQSYMRSMMRSTAEANGRDPRIAEGMVDETIEIEGIKPAGKVLTFTTSEAIKHGYCEGQAASIKEILAQHNIRDYRLVRYELSFTERIISFVLNPFISGILILLILGGLYYELQAPGIGFPLATAIVAAVLYLVPYYLNGLAANWEIITLVLGVLLLAAEVFVLPGFGVAGISGLVLVFGSLVLIMLDNDWFDFTRVATAKLWQSLVAVSLGMAGSLVLIVVTGAKVLNSKRFKKLTLQHTLEREDGYTSTYITRELIGKTGTAYTVLRPSGKVMIDGTLYDAATRGEYVDSGTPVTVISQEGTSIRVRKEVMA
ncbi:MAG: nodulation protein NfeD [Cytophagales bacterium]|nr:nodulation protein NfeD [Cytophagales bacterium]